jgi:phage tail-like protein
VSIAGMGMQATSEATNLIETLGMSYRFMLAIDNPVYDLGFWQKVSGLTVTWDIAAVRAGDQGNDFWIYPGQSKYTNIKLTRPISPTSNVTQAWLSKTSNAMQPQSGAIMLCAAMGIPIIKWVLYNLFPVSWQVGEFTAETGKVVTETLEIAHTGFLEDQLLPG